MRYRQVSASVHRTQEKELLRSINRNRRIKCDESKPRCSNCTKAERDCVYSDRSVQSASVGNSLLKPTSVHSTPAEPSFINHIPVRLRKGFSFTPAPLRDISEATEKLRSLLEVSAAAIDKTKVLSIKTECFELYEKAIAGLRDNPYTGREVSMVLEALKYFDSILEEVESSLLASGDNILRVADECYAYNDSSTAPK